LEQLADNNTICKVSWDERIELARMALAAMDSKTHDAISFDEWSRKCALQITLCYPDFREKAQYIWDSARETQQPAPVVPDGYVMVPKEPTEAMMLHNSGCQHHAWDDPDCAMRQTRRLIWSHMLAAAPQEVK
ncbi:hypothetical protein ABNJ14_004585, partial [Klebsiella variicola]